MLNTLTMTTLYHERATHMLALCNSWDILALMYATRKRFDKVEHVLNDSTLDYLGGYLYELVAGYQKVCLPIDFRMPGLSRRRYDNRDDRYVYEFSLIGYIEFMRQRAVRVLTGLFCRDLVKYIADMCAEMYLEDIKWIINTRGRGEMKVICDLVLTRMNLVHH
jgi:hypothetical protein